MKLRRFSPLCAEEPFRALFPLGFALGFLGVLLWPLFFLGGIRTYPGIAHARLMVEGFVACFIFGFLGTAGPRVLSVPHFTRSEVARLLLAVPAACALHLGGAHAFGDAVFLTALLLFVWSLGKRFRQREDSPPPNFALVGLGLLNGIAGAGLLTFCEASNSAPNLARLATSFLGLGFLLLPLMGVAPFFLRRLLDLPTDDAGGARRNQLREAGKAIAAGLAIDVLFALEIYTTNPTLGWARFGIVALYLGSTLPMRGNSTLAAGLRLSLTSVVSGLALWALIPTYRLPVLHIVFIGGFGLAIFSVATRVILGHSGNLGLVRRRRAWLIGALILILLAMISRFVSDFVPTRNSHLLWGAICWLLGAGIWAAIALPHIGQVEEESPAG